MIPGAGRAQALFDRVFAGWRALAIPALYFVLLEAVLFSHHIDDSHDFFFDGVAHLRYIPAFLFGFGLAGSRVVMDALARHWKPAALLAVGSYATIATLLVIYPDFSFPTHNVTMLYRFVRHLETWTAIAALIGIAETYWNHNSNWRAMLAEATFPFYIIHQTTIVVVGYWLVQAGTSAGVQFPVLVVATIASCWAFYLGGREIDWLRPLVGLKRKPAAPRATKPLEPLWMRSDRAQPDLA
jgi:glucans biosynthesis protein C